MTENNSQPVLKGLILCGGQSRRMQTDKSLLEYGELPQWKYVQRLLEPFVINTWISCRKEQASLYAETSNLLYDDETSGTAGPAAGMLAAHRRFQETAWLVVACDLPLVTADSIKALVTGRAHMLPATAILNPEKGWPEPLLAIWEPSGLRILEKNAGENHYCPRKTLGQCNPRLIKLSDPGELFNANTPAERALAQRALAERAPEEERPVVAARNH